MDSEDSDTFAPHSHHQALRAPRTGSDAWSKDKRALVAWVGSVLGAALLSWGIWATVAIFGVQREQAVACTESKAIQAQLARIETRLAEMQLALYRGGRP